MSKTNTAKWNLGFVNLYKSKPLGKGVSGKVYLVTDRNQNLCAAKVCTRALAERFVLDYNGSIHAIEQQLTTASDTKEIQGLCTTDILYEIAVYKSSVRKRPPTNIPRFLGSGVLDLKNGDRHLALVMEYFPLGTLCQRMSDLRDIRGIPSRETYFTQESPVQTRNPPRSTILPKARTAQRLSSFTVDIGKMGDGAFVTVFKQRYAPFTPHQLYQRFYDRETREWLSEDGNPYEQPLDRGFVSLFPPAEAIQVVHDIACALEFLHVTLKYTHCDVRSPNIFMRYNPSLEAQQGKVTWVLGDFGYATRCDRAVGETPPQFPWAHDAMNWDELPEFPWAPESVVSPDRHTSKTKNLYSADIWSLGVLWYHLMYLDSPFVASTLAKGVEYAYEGQSVSRLSISRLWPIDMPAELNPLFENLLQFLPHNRPTISFVKKVLAKALSDFNKTTSATTLDYSLKRPCDSPTMFPPKKRVCSRPAVVLPSGTVTHITIQPRTRKSNTNNNTPDLLCYETLQPSD